MITKHDELFCHQAVSTFDSPGTSAREWTERAWAQVHHIAGTGHLATGLGYYPNRNIMDAFACFTVQDKKQYIVRASRELRPGIDVLQVGPFRHEVVEPLKKVRYTLSENEFGLSYDIEVEGTSRLYMLPGTGYQAPGGYGWQYKGFIHGIWMGPSWKDGYRLDLGDPEVMREIWGYVDYGCEFRCSGEIGYGTTELLVVGKYPRYGYYGY